MEVRDLLADALTMSSDNFPPVDLVKAGLDSGALASKSYPCPVEHYNYEEGADVPHPLDHQPFVAAREAPEVAAAAVDYPISRSVLHPGPSAVLGLAAVQMKRQTGRAEVAAPLGQVAAIAGMACLSLNSKRGELVRDASRLLYRRLPLRTGAAA